MEADTITQFELARTEYIEIDVLVDVLNEERHQWYTDHGLTRETLAAWLREHGDPEELPSELRQINEASFEAVQVRSDAYHKLIAAAREVTSALIQKHGFDRLTPDDLEMLFDHMARRPFSPGSRKMLDALLRLDVRR